MSDKKQTKIPTNLTLTLPDPGDEGTLLIRRGDLAHVREFVYTVETDFTSIIRQAMEALSFVESDPPVIPDVPPEKAAAKAAPPPEPEPPAEPTVDIPVKKGKLTIPQRHLQIPNGDPGTEAYQQAVLIAGRLIDGRLWDGKCHICINDVDDAQRKLKHLSDKDLSLFTLEDFARRITDEELGTGEETQDSPDTTGEEGLPQDRPDNDLAPAGEEYDANQIAEHPAALPTLPDNTAQPDLL